MYSLTADGTEMWMNSHWNLHRIDGPAREWSDGTKEWWVDGKRHRTDGPAIEWADGCKEWYVDRKHHRTDGPAIEWADGRKEWYVDGWKVGPEVHHKRLVTETSIGLKGLDLPVLLILEIVSHLVYEEGITMHQEWQIAKKVKQKR